MAEAPVTLPRTFDWKRNPNHAADQVAAMRKHLTLGDPALSQGAIDGTMAALRDIADELRTTNWRDVDYCDKCKRGGLKPADLAKTASYLAKVVDEIYRLAQFAGGGPDSRTEASIDEILKWLTPEEFKLIQERMAAAKAVVVDAP